VEGGTIITTITAPASIKNTHRESLLSKEGKYHTVGVEKKRGGQDIEGAVTEEKCSFKNGEY